MRPVRMPGSPRWRISSSNGSVDRRCKRRGVPGLVDTECAAAGQGEMRQRAPRLLFDRSACERMRPHLGDEGVDVVAHQIEVMATILVGGVDGDFGGWQLENEP